MKLVIESADYVKIGLKAGEYDLDDLNAIKCAIMLKAKPGSDAEIEIELRLHAGMKPEPGSIGEPHFKFGITVDKNPQYSTRDVTIFGRPEELTGYTGLGYKVHVDDRDLVNLSEADMKDHVRNVVAPGVRSVADEVVRLLVEEAVREVLDNGYGTAGTKTGRTQTRTPNQAAQDQFFGLPTAKTAGKCGECGGSGVWKNPANGRESDCSKGCPKS